MSYTCFSSRTWSCTGSLIFDDYVLTAGHCVYECSDFTIYAGVYNRNNPLGSAQARRVILDNGAPGVRFFFPRENKKKY